mgnify:CR=1 FL=1
MEALIKIGSAEAGDTLNEMKSRGLQFEVSSIQEDIEEGDAYSEAIIDVPNVQIFINELKTKYDESPIDFLIGVDDQNDNDVFWEA